MKEGVAAIAVGAPLFLWGLSQFRKSRATAAWPAAQGWIIRSAVKAEFSRGDQDTADSWTHYPEVQYQYQLGQQVFAGNSIATVKRGYQHPHQAQAILSAYPAGTMCTVYYNPAKPHEAVLQTGKSEGIPLIAVGGLILLAGIAGVAA
jgi:hypothetical protein